ncbi:hypothetical protein EBU91_04610, partial [bacterium]|nr:hypothetical protein [bacterium]
MHMSEETKNLNQSEKEHNHDDFKENDSKSDSNYHKTNEKEKSNFTKRQLFFIALLFGVVVGSIGGWIGYKYYDFFPSTVNNSASKYSNNSNSDLNNNLQNNQNTSSYNYSPPEYAEGYRDGKNGTKLTKAADVVVDEIVASLKESYIKNGQYPIPAYSAQSNDSETVYIQQIADKYGYVVYISSVVKCPIDNGVISYKPTKNQKTEKYDSYKI